MSAKEKFPKISLPRGWSENVKSAMLHVISLAHFGMAYTHGWAANSVNSRIRLKAKYERLQQQVAQLTEEIRIKDARMSGSIPAIDLTTRRPSEWPFYCSERPTAGH